MLPNCVLRLNLEAKFRIYVSTLQEWNFGRSDTIIVRCYVACIFLQWYVLRNLMKYFLWMSYVSYPARSYLWMWIVKRFHNRVSDRQHLNVLPRRNHIRKSDACSFMPRMYYPIFYRLSQGNVQPISVLLDRLFPKQFFKLTRVTGKLTVSNFKLEAIFLSGFLWFFSACSDCSNSGSQLLDPSWIIDQKRPTNSAVKWLLELQQFSCTVSSRLSIR